MYEQLKGKSPRIMLIGDVMVDHYIGGSSSRLSPEAPIQVVDVKSEKRTLGGAGNVLNNLNSLGAKATLISVVGRDSEGDWVHRDLLQSGGEHKIFRSDRDTTVKSRILATNHQLLRLDRESRQSIERDIENSIIDFVELNIENFDALLISDYGKGVITDRVSKSVIEIAKSRKVPSFIDPKGTNYEKYRGADFLKPNRKEAIEALGRDGDIDEIGKTLREKFEIENLVITLSEDGMKLFSSDGVHHLKTFAKEVFDVTGAGDTALASLSFGVASGLEVEKALHFSNLCSAVVVGKVGTATVTLKEVFRENREILDRDELAETIEKCKRDGKKVIFTNGVFDILHIGHTRYLQKARELGDILVVGVNSDSSVKRLKGETRPVNRDLDRAELLLQLRWVDYVVIFTEDTPYTLIETLKPHTLVKGGDYRGKEVIGSDLVDEVHLIDFVDGKSTTSIIEKIQS